MGVAGEAESDKGGLRLKRTWRRQNTGFVEKEWETGPAVSVVLGSSLWSSMVLMQSPPN